MIVLFLLSEFANSTAYGANDFALTPQQLAIAMQQFKQIVARDGEIIDKLAQNGTLQELLNNRTEFRITADGSLEVMGQEVVSPATDEYTYPAQSVYEVGQSGGGQYTHPEYTTGMPDGNGAHMMCDSTSQDTVEIVDMFTPGHPAYGQFQVMTKYGLPTDPTKQTNYFSLWTYVGGNWQMIGLDEVWMANYGLITVGSSDYTYLVGIACRNVGNTYQDVYVDSILAQYRFY